MRAAKASEMSHALTLTMPSFRPHPLSEASAVTKSRAEGLEVCLPTVEPRQGRSLLTPWPIASLSSPLLGPPRSHA